MQGQLFPTCEQSVERSRFDTGKEEGSSLCRTSPPFSQRKKLLLLSALFTQCDPGLRSRRCRAARGKSFLFFFEFLKPPSLPLSIAMTKAAAKPAPCDSGSRVFTFGVAHPQQLDCISYLFPPLVVVVCTPHSLGCSACKQENRKDCLSPPPLSFYAAAPRGCIRPAVGLLFLRVKRCSERLACLHTSTFHRLLLPLLRLG